MLVIGPAISPAWSVTAPRAHVAAFHQPVDSWSTYKLPATSHRRSGAAEMSLTALHEGQRSAGDSFASELAAAQHASREIRELLEDASHPEEVELLVDRARKIAEFELNNEGANYRGGTWFTHLDEHVLSIALVDREHGPVVGVVHRRSTDETISASLDGGAWLESSSRLHGEHDSEWGECVQEARAGNASPHAQVLHVPSGSCHALDVALDSIELAMPCKVQRNYGPRRSAQFAAQFSDAPPSALPSQVQRVPGCCCCEGLFELVAGRADVHVTPPAALQGNMQQLPTPLPLLCAFSVLLDEAGGAFTDAYGQEIDFSLTGDATAFAAPRHDRGLVATEFSSLNYFKRFTRSAFEDAAAGTEFWNADLRRHVFHAAPAPATEDTEDVERMRARLSYLLESREELDDEWREELDEE